MIGASAVKADAAEAGSVKDDAAEVDARRLPAVCVEEAVVFPDRIEFLVRLAPDVQLRTTPQLVEAVLQRHPYLLEHACRNDVGPTFGAVACNTPLAHLLEHVAVDIQTRAAADRQQTRSTTVFMGTTERVGDDPRRARIRLSMSSDVECFAAMKQAVALLNELLS